MVNDLGTVIGKELGGIAVGVIYVVKALKNQPGFDNAEFEKEIQYYVDNLGDDKESTKAFLKALID
ncbi:hypothetical protein [Pseudomonas oryzihabitans]|uniref:hypothetical protein n=1 Tax=Pseudomonas oryzihabitans TaxID=47885 RepID=UPI001642F6E0|nr:hypothetical protein [Pseudomonas psychrotolerans]